MSADDAANIKRGARMSIGFLSSKDNDGSDRGHSELSPAQESWLVWQAREAWGLNAMLTNSCQALLGQVRAYAAVLEMIDPGNFNAEQEVAKVTLELIGDASAEHRLHVLTGEARRLMLAVAEAKRKRLLSNRCLAALEYLTPLAPLAAAIFYSVMAAVYVLELVRDFF